MMFLGGIGMQQITAMVLGWLDKPVPSSRALLLSAVLLNACTQVPDLSAMNAERAKPIQRYDTVQALAANGTAVVAGTQNGAVLVSADQGKTWSRKELGPFTSLIGLSSCPDGSFVGIDFNHKVWSSDARGTEWKSVALNKPRVPLVVACDAQGYWYVGGSRATIARSVDKGANWQVSDLGEDAQILAFAITGSQTGIALGEFGLVAKTDDGGATWKLGSRISADFYPYATVFLNSKEGYVSGGAGTALRTQDGGNTWNKIENATHASLYRLFLHEGKPYGVGPGGTIARLEDNVFLPVPYADAVSVFLGTGTSLPAQAAIVIGGPGGLVRVIDTPKLSEGKEHNG